MIRAEGGCLCGDVRYAFEADPEFLVYCHCRLCQRAHGAPAVAWAVLPRASVEIVKGEPAVYRSSPKAERLFCRRCGTHLIFRPDDRPQHLDVAIATLSDPAGFAPTLHVWTESRIPWFDTSDHLPRLPQG